MTTEALCDLLDALNEPCVCETREPHTDKDEDCAAHPLYRWWRDPGQSFERVSDDVLPVQVPGLTRTPF